MKPRGEVMRAEIQRAEGGVATSLPPPPFLFSKIFINSRFFAKKEERSHDNQKGEIKFQKCVDKVVLDLACLNCVSRLRWGDTTLLFLSILKRMIAGSNVSLKDSM